ncbi:MAG TPA: VWA domain-containing protein [Thermoanaerobaculia bacterium]|nr:VWA domain-containing protein [Thermoanaerobaculia bacterium]
MGLAVRAPWYGRSIWTGLLLLGLPLGAPAVEVDDLEPRHREFLDQVELLITPREREVFFALSADFRRDAFVRRFWQVRDPFPETGRNELLDRWAENHAAAHERYRDEGDARVRVATLLGLPDRTLPIRCDRLRPLEIWHFPPGAPLRAEAWAVFVQRGGRYELWAPGEGLRSLLLFSSTLDDHEALRELERECSFADDLVAALSLSPDWSELTERLAPDPGAEWAESFLASSTELPAGVEAIPASLDVSFVGRHQSRTVVRAVVHLDRAAIATVERDGQRWIDLLVDGEVVRDETLFESFRYRFDLPQSVTADVEGETVVPVQIERFLRPGRYRLELKVQDLEGERYFRADRELDVPRWAAPAAEPGMSARPAHSFGLEGLDRELAEEGEAGAVVRLRAPTDRLLVGKVRVEALAEGAGVERVRFELDGRTLLTKGRPPYSVEIDLGRAPRTHRLAATALDRDGHELARDEMDLNAGPHRFAVRLVEPQPGKTYRDVVRAAAEVDVPRLERLERVEFYLNETLVAALYQPPFVQPIAVPAELELAYVRVLGVLEGGSAAEDVVFVNAPDTVESLDVDFVELYTTVLDRKGRSVEGLSLEDFEVREAGRPQAVRRFELVRDLPIHAGILLDTSISMTERLEDAEKAAHAFFERVLTPRDRACLMTFNDVHALVVPFTNSPAVLAGGLGNLVAEGGTALYDSLIQALFYFNGLRGKRALILLTDGEDSGSSYGYDEVLEFARRSGVAIYGIGLSIEQRDLDVRSKLNRLCTETGGDCAFIDSATELAGVYERIERELRSQYLLAYQSTASGKEFREIEVKVQGSGLRARTIGGYYP